MSDLTTTELVARLAEAEDRIAELETARLRAETLFAVTQVLGKTLSLQETFETILGQLQKVVPYDSSSVQVIQDQRLVIVHGRGFDHLDSLLGSASPWTTRQIPASRCCGRSASSSSATYPITRTSRASSTAADGFADGSARR